MKKKKATKKLLSFALAAVMLAQMSVQPIHALTMETLEWAAQNKKETISNLSDSPPSLDEITPPTVESNPYNVSVTVDAQPIYNSKIYTDLRSSKLITSIQQWGSADAARSPYYTASLTNRYQYVASDTATVIQNLPYKEGTPNMLHPDLTLKNGWLYMLGGGELADASYISKDQTYLRIGATVIAGEGYVSFEKYNENVSQIRAQGDPDNPDLQVDLPLTAYNPSVQAPYFTTSEDGIMTDMHVALIDDTAPQVLSVNTKIEGTDLRLTMTFNEQLRWASTDQINLNRLYVVVELKETKSNATQTVKLYLEGLDGNSLNFRGALGDYIYKSFRVSRVKEVNFDNKYRAFRVAGIDAVGSMYTSPYETVTYGNGTLQNVYQISSYFTAITDYAGNSLKDSALTNWYLSDGAVNDVDTFEILEVKFYNEMTVGKALEEPSVPTDWPEDIDRTHLFAGPDNTLTVHMIANTSLTKAEAKLVTATLNIRKADGTPLKATCSSSYTFEPTDEVYGSGNASTLTRLIFDGIELEEGMTLTTESPQLAVIGMESAIEHKPVYYPETVESSRALYGDFTAPITAVNVVTATPDDPVDGYYPLIAELKVEEVLDAEKTFYAGTQGTEAEFWIGSESVNQASRIRYVLVDNLSKAPKTYADYTEDAILPRSGKALLGIKPITAQSQTYYLYLLVESGGLQLDDLNLSILAKDLVGNRADETPITFEYKIDEIAPTVSFVGKPQTTFILENTSAEVRATVQFRDHNTVRTLQYYFESTVGKDEENLEGDGGILDYENPDGWAWKNAVIQEGTVGEVTLPTEIYYGLDPESNVTYNDVLWVRAVDAFGNVSEPIFRAITVSLAKPETDAVLESDPELPNTHPTLTVNGPAKSPDTAEDDGFTRVSITPISETDSWEYVTVVGTGTTLDLFSFTGEWYIVKRSGNVFTEVRGPYKTSDYTEVNEENPFYQLLTYYGELKISFENGYADMTPVENAYVYSSARGGSYLADQNFYTVRYASQAVDQLDIHRVDFGKIVDRDNETRAEDGDAGNAAILYNATKKGVNPLRSTRISFSLSNLVMSEWGLLDLNFAASYIELHQVDDRGDKVIDLVQGLAGSDSQYYAIPEKTMDGEDFTTGQYYLRVYVVSYSGAVEFFNSINLVLDASLVENDGLWEYGHYVAFHSGNTPSTLTYTAEDAPFASMGLSVGITEEIARSDVFALYTGGVRGYEMTILTDQAKRTYDGFTVGGVSGIRMWNLLSAPTEEELENYGFVGTTIETETTAGRKITRDWMNIYTEETIPKGAEGENSVAPYLVKGVNTICYQIKMDNGYVSPVRQFTVIVTDYMPTLNLAIDTYTPSYEVSQLDGVFNAHDVTYFVEAAYSLNGSGEVNVQLWGTYDIAVNGTKTSYSTNILHHLSVLKTGMDIEDTVVLTENSYTSSFPPEEAGRCTAVVVAIDEYGGMAVVAPQLGNQPRVDNPGDMIGYQEYNINYDGGYQDDPFALEYNPFELRYFYNQPVKSGKNLLGFENTFSYKNGDEVVVETLPTTLEYNLFHIDTNDVTWGLGKQTFGRANATSGILYDDGFNFELINWDSTTITFWGGDLGETEVTVPLAGGTPNAAGYMGGYCFFSEDEDEDEEKQVFSFSVASIQKPADKTLEELNQDTYPNPQNPNQIADPLGHISRFYMIRGYNLYGTPFELGGSVSMYYVDYEDAVFYVEPEDKIDGHYSETMTPHGVDLLLTVPTLECDTQLQTHVFQNGLYTKELHDYYGNAFTLTYDITVCTDTGTTVTYSETNKTSNPVVVTIRRDTPVYVDLVDSEVMSLITPNGQPSVSVLINKNVEFTYRYALEDGTESVNVVEVNNIVEPNIRVVWSENISSYQNNYDEETGEYYRYGSVTAYLVDNNFTLRDRYTGEIPSFTFYPDGQGAYTFRGSDIELILGNEKPLTLNTDVVADLNGLVLRENPDPLGLYDPETGEPLRDTEAPNVQILAYANQNGYYVRQKLAMQVTGARNAYALNEHPGYEVLSYVGNRGTAAELLSRIGWSSSYRFEIEVADMSRTRLFVKEGLYGDAPDFETGISDAIPGVKLNSRLLTVTENARFTLYVVDKENQSTSIPFDVSNLSEAPVPTAIKAPQSNSVIRVYVTPPTAPDGTAITNFTLTAPANAVSENGVWYVDYNYGDDGVDNGQEQILNYSYLYNTSSDSASTINGSLRVTLNEFSTDTIELVGGAQWSSNKGLESTDRDITAIVTLSRAVQEVKVKSEYDPNVVSFTVAGTKVTVRYKDNHGPVEFTCVAYNGTEITTELGAVTNIDRAAPVITLIGKELAAHGRSITITMASNERAMFREGGYVGEERTDDQGNVLYCFTRTVTANGSYLYHFVDSAGSITVFTVEVSEIVDTELAVLYSLSADGTNPVTDPALLTIQIGDVIYAKPSRDVSAEFNGGAAMEMKAAEWTALTISDSLGGRQPYLVATDAYGNVLTHQFSQIIIPDTTPPEILIARYSLSIAVDADRAAVEAALLENFYAFDSEDAAEDLIYAVTFTENLSVTGVTNVEYSATDRSGNTAKAIGKLRIMEGGEPWVYVNGEQVDRDGSAILSAGDENTLAVNTEGSPYTVFMKAGIKTIAQMKIGSTNLTEGYVAGTDPISLGALTSGYYTVCVLTQNRDYFRIILYVE